MGDTNGRYKWEIQMGDYLRIELQYTLFLPKAEIPL